MQNTLLGIAIFLILALAAALVGPSFVDWNNHRAFFEAEASRLTGLPVRVTGAIDVTLLPTPSMTLRAIEIGNANDESRLRAAALAMTLGLGPLMRGELKAVDVRLVGPELSLKLNQSGTLEMPRMTMGFSPDTVGIDRLTVEEGRAILIDATSGMRVVVDKLSFKGQMRSLAGPYRGEGGFFIADARYRYHINTARLADDGMKFKLGLDTEWPLTLEADGTVAFDHGAPKFEGNFTLTRPAGAAGPTGKAVVSEPWNATSKVTISSAAALFEQIEFNYGPEERVLKLNGAAELKFGEHPRLQGVLSGRHMDVDRLIARPEMVRHLPFAAMKSFAEAFQGMLRPSLPTRLTVNVDTVTLGGAMLQMVSGDLSTRGAAWQLERLEFRAPGFTQVSASGRIEPTSKGLGFTGFADVNATDSTTLIGWLTGRGNPAPGPFKGLSARGDVTLTSERIAVENLKSKYDQATLEGRFDYAWPIGDRPSHFYAALGASEIDIDTWMQAGETIFAGLDLQWPRDVTLALDIDKARMMGFEARKAAVQLKMDRDEFDLKRFTVENFGGLAFEAAGRIESLSTAPHGAIKLNLDARELASVLVLADRFAPALVDPIRRLAGRQSTIKLAANVGVESSAPDAATKRATAKIGVEGRIGAFRLNATANTSADPAVLSRADLAALVGGDVRLEGQIDTDDGAAMLSLFNLDRMAASENLPGQLKLTAIGPLNRGIRLDGRLAVGLVDLTGSGNATLSFDQPPTVKFGQVSGTIGASKVQGGVAVTFGSPVRIEGAIDADRVDVPACVAVMIGTPQQKLKSSDQSGAQKWSLEPFAQNPLRLAGRIEVKVARAVLNEKLDARAVQAVWQFGAAKSEVEIKDADFGAGRLTGQFTFVSSNEGLSMLSFLDLIGADAAVLFPAEGRTPVGGILSLRITDMEGAGLSPAAFFGSLHGNGSITFEDAKFAGLNPNVFEALTRAVDLGIPADTRQIREFVDIIINVGRLAVKKADAKFTIAGGQARVSVPRVEGSGADLGVTASLNLSDATLDATLALSGTAAGLAGRPAVAVMLKGPLTAPNYAFNSDLLARWLALRSVEQQSKRVEVLEAARRMLGQTTSLLPTTSAAPAGRVTDDDDTNSTSQPSSPDPSSTGPTTSTSPITPVIPDTTGGIFGAVPVPPLPPPVTIQ